VDRSSRILRNVASNWTGFAVNAVVTLVLTPVILRELGEARYGIWILTSSIIGYYGMLDLGFRAGVNQFLTRSLAVPDFERASNVISTAFVALSLLGLGMAGLSVAAAYMVPEIFDLPPATEQEAFWCILIIGATAGIQCVLSPFSAVFVAKQRFDLSNLIGVSTRLPTAIGIYVALKSGYGLIGISLATGAGTILDYVIRWIVARRLVPELQVSRNRSNLSQLREIGSFGIWNFLIEVSRFVYLYMQPLLIGFLMPISAVGYYALAAGLWYQINGLLGPIGQVLYPAAAEMDVRGERESMRRLYSVGSRLMLLVVIPVVLIAYFWAPDFYRLWIGEKYLTGETYASVSDILRVLLIGTLLSYTSNVAGQIILAAGHIRQLALLQISGAVLNLTASLILIHYFGLIGVAIAAILATIVVDLVGIPVVLNRHVGIHVKEFLLSAWARLVGVALLLAMLILGIRQLEQPEQWTELIMQGILAGCAAVAVLIIIGITAEERNRLLAKPIYRLRAMYGSRPAQEK